MSLPATPPGWPKPKQRECSTCGAPTLLKWCSTVCHKADEPGAYEERGEYGLELDAWRKAVNG